MKITKSELRKIIKEEKAKLLKESVTDMRKYEEQTDVISLNLAELFHDDMRALFDQAPEMIKSTQEEWNREVEIASERLESLIQQSIIDAIQRVESELHNGTYAPKPQSEGTDLGNMPDAWRQVLGNCLADNNGNKK
jgi:hypothetical protein